MNETEARFWRHVNKADDCWLWAAQTSDGYGRFSVNGRSTRAHRFAWEMRHGPIPDERQIDHLCRVRRCVNPDHMELVDNRTNVLRGVGLTAQNARKTHCDAGHLLSGENLYDGDGRRQCRACKREFDRRRMRDPEHRAKKAAWMRKHRAALTPPGKEE